MVLDAEGNPVPKQFDIVHFRVGYQRNCDQLIISLKRVYTATIYNEDGTPEYYDFKGKMILHQRIYLVFDKILDVIRVNL